MLKNGGVFVRFANHPYRDKGKPALSEDIDQIYAEYYYKFYNKEPETPIEYTEQQAHDRALIAEKYGFTDIQYKLFYRTRTFTAKEYIHFSVHIQTILLLKKLSEMNFFQR
jgi:hypothetical protein